LTRSLKNPDGISGIIAQSGEQCNQQFKKQQVARQKIEKNFTKFFWVSLAVCLGHKLLRGISLQSVIIDMENHRLEAYARVLPSLHERHKLLKTGVLRWQKKLVCLLSNNKIDCNFTLFV